jgi:hypothetical protein
MIDGNVLACGCTMDQALGQRTELGEYCERCGTIFHRPTGAELEKMIEIGRWQWERERARRIADQLVEAELEQLVEAELEQPVEAELEQPVEAELEQHREITP